MRCVTIKKPNPVTEAGRSLDRKTGPPQRGPGEAAGVEIRAGLLALGVAVERRLARVTRRRPDGPKAHSAQRFQAQAAAPLVRNERRADRGPRGHRALD